MLLTVTFYMLVPEFTKTRPIQELRDLAGSNGLTAEAIEQEIAARTDTIKNLIGWLYQDILRTEIEELDGMLTALRFLARSPT